jgi:RNA polymerase sigma-70 factor, ECF subfamily
MSTETTSHDASDAFAAHIAVAREAWPTLTWDVATYRAWLVDACGNEHELATRLPSLDPAESVLCWTAGSGDAEAHRLFDLHYMHQVGPALRRFGGDAAFADEVAQRVRVKLLVATSGAHAPIARYALGTGLAGLVRTAAVREALSLRRGDKRSEPEATLDVVVGEADPELRALKDRYAREFQRAFTAAVTELSAKDRHLLRLSLSAHASIDDIARMHQTHRATAARWLNAARDELAAKTRQHLQAALVVGDDELQSLLRLIRTEAPRLLESIPPDRDD